MGSAVIRLTTHRQPPVKAADEKLMFQIIRASFNQRRKTLANGLKNYEGFHYSREEIEEALKACHLAPNVRGESLVLAEFAALSDILKGVS